MEKFLSWLISSKAITSIVIALLAVALWIIINKIKKKRMGKMAKQKNSRRTFTNIIYSVLKVVLLFLAITTILQINGINVSSLLAGVGIASAIVGLALQDFLKDIIMGFHIIGDQFFNIGDVVEYRDFEAEVIGLTFQTTKLRRLTDQSVFTVCNRNISEILRVSHILDIDIPISYTQDVPKLKKVSKSICKRISNVDHVEKCEFRGAKAFEDSSIPYTIRITCTPRYRAVIRREALTVIIDEFNNNGVVIPFNQLDVHMIESVQEEQ